MMAEMRSLEDAEVLQSYS